MQIDPKLALPWYLTGSHKAKKKVWERVVWELHLKHFTSFYYIFINFHVSSFILSQATASNCNLAASAAALASAKRGSASPSAHIVIFVFTAFVAALSLLDLGLWHLWAMEPIELVTRPTMTPSQWWPWWPWWPRPAPASAWRTGVGTIWVVTTRGFSNMPSIWQSWAVGNHCLGMGAEQLRKNWISKSSWNSEECEESSTSTASLRSHSWRLQ